MGLENVAVIFGTPSSSFCTFDTLQIPTHYVSQFLLAYAMEVAFEPLNCRQHSCMSFSKEECITHFY